MKVIVTVFLDFVRDLPKKVEKNVHDVSPSQEFKTTSSMALFISKRC